MGLIKATKGAFGGTFGDQWKEFFYCESLDKDVLVTKGYKKQGKRSTNYYGEDNIISNGSTIAVADGQCMIIVEQGRVVEFCAEPGEFVYDKSTEPSLFTGNLGESILETFKTIGRRVSYGGDTGKDQRVYYFNLKEIIENKFGTANPLMFRVVDKNIGLDREVTVKCHGIYSYKISNPILFYMNVCGNVSSMYTRSEIDSQLKTEFIDALQPAFAVLSDLNLRPSQIPAHAIELKDAMNNALNEKWQKLRGITIVSIAMNPIILDDDDLKKIQDFQDRAVLRDPGMAAATLTEAQADALRSAASNEAGAMMGFMGLGMAQQAGGMNAQSLYQMSAQQRQNDRIDTAANGWKCSCGAVNTGKFCSECGKSKPQEQSGWTCECGAVNTGKFCQNCGKPKPQEQGSWICECGTANTGKFCQNCGKPKTAEYKCSTCGWEPEEPANPPKFCPQCGNPFGDEDKK